MDVTGKVDTKGPQETNREVKEIYTNAFNSTPFDKVEYILADIVNLFDGKYPGYKKCDTVYHNLEHTLQAYLATARLFDGLIKENPAGISDEFVLLGLIAALGHDTGFIKEIGDDGGSGGKYTLIHVDRSKEFIEKYLLRMKFNPSQIQCVQNIISCTGLWADLSRIPFLSEMEMETGYILGTADYLGQMSDPDYPAKLPGLYREYEEGGFLEYTSVQDLINKTPEFFEKVVMKRLKEDYHSVYRFAANHFGGKNFYIDGINRNIAQIREQFPV